MGPPASFARRVYAIPRRRDRIPPNARHAARQDVGRPASQFQCAGRDRLSVVGVTAGIIGVLWYVSGLRIFLVGVPLVPGAGLEPARPCGRGIFVLATAFAAEPRQAHLESGLYLCHRSAQTTLAIRQGPSSLYTFPWAIRTRGLSSGLQAPRSAVGLVPRI